MAGVRSDLKRAARALATRHPEAALPILREVVCRAPEDPRHRLLLACALADSGTFEEAHQFFAEVRRARNDLIAARVFLARLLLDEGRIDEAVAELRPALAAAPANELARIVLGLAFLAQGRLADGVREIDQHGAAGDPELAGRLLVFLEERAGPADAYHPALPPGATDDAIPSLPRPPRRVRGTPPGRWTLFRLRRRFHAGLAHRRAFQMARALSAWFSVLVILPDETDTLVEIAETYYLLSRFDDARAALDRLPAAEREAERARALRGLVLFSSGDREAARPLLAQAAGREREVAATDEPIDLAAAGMVYYAAGKLALADGDRLAARRHFERAAALDPFLLPARWEAFKEGI